MTFHIFDKQDWESKLNVESTCKKWRIWSTLRHIGYTDQPIFRGNTTFKSWALQDIIYNNDMDLIYLVEEMHA